MKRPVLLLILAIGLIPFWTGADDVSTVTAIKGARIVPVVGEDIPEGTIIIRGNRVEAIGRDIPIPPGARIIDASGLSAYPGMIDGWSSLGLSEIGSIAATIDSGQAGATPSRRAIVARAASASLRWRAMMEGQPPGTASASVRRAMGIESHAVGSKVPVQSNSSRNRERPGYSWLRPWLTTSGVVASRRSASCPKTRR